MSAIPIIAVIPTLENQTKGDVFLEKLVITVTEIVLAR